MNTHEPAPPITAALLRSRLADQTPSVVQKHWVEVDGVRWPVTQALAIATGKPGVKSNRARRELQRLGFLVGQDAPPTLGTQIAPRLAKARDPAFDQNALIAKESAELSLRYTWLRAGSITLDANSHPSFPPLPSTPGLYRFDFGIDQDGVAVVYIGEGKSVADRAMQYRRRRSTRNVL